MDFADIRSRIKTLLTIGGFNNSQPPPDYAFLANEGARLFSWRAQHLTADTTITTVAGTAEYTLTVPPDWILIEDATYGTTRILFQSDESRERRKDPLWTQRASATPIVFWMPKANVIRLHPKPDTAGDTVYMHGYQCEPVLDSDGDVPLAPEKFHEAICLYGAQHQMVATAIGEEMVRAEKYLAKADALADSLKEAMAGQDAVVLQRRVRRESPETLFLDQRYPFIHY